MPWEVRYTLCYQENFNSQERSFVRWTIIARITWTINNWVLAICQMLPGRLSTLRWKRSQSLMPGFRSQNWMFRRTTAFPAERRWGWRETIEVGETQLTWGSWTVTPQGCVEKTNICNYSIGEKISHKFDLLCNFEYSQKS